MKVATPNTLGLLKTAVKIPGNEYALWAASRPAHHAPASHLTPRQVEVLALLCQGLPNKLICKRLNIASGTVKVHISCILRELGVTTRLQAVVASLAVLPGAAAAVAAATLAAAPLATAASG